MSVCDGLETVLGPGGRPLTDEQLEAIELRDGPLLLDANAGSGKTTVMVERFVRAVVCDDVPVGGILAITFTDKAAAELRDRIRRRFAELDEDDHAREAEGAFISTIHGFCARMLRSHPLDAGLDPRFVVIDETQADRLSGLAFDAALESVLDAGGDVALDAFSAFKIPDLRDLTIAAHGVLRTRGEARPRVPAVTPRDLGRAAAGLAERAERLARTLDGTTIAAELTALEAVGRCRERLADLDSRGADGPSISPAEVAELKIPGKVSGLLKEEAAIGYRTAYDELLRACVDCAALPTYQWIGEIVAAFADRYAQLKAERSGLDFEDLELRALDLLQTRPAVRARYADRFAHVMVDEFQDTNPLQLALLDALSTDRRFVVGDAFQSIYRFRHADVGLFSAERERLDALDRVRVLTSNFRSRPELIDAFNLVFADSAFPDGFVPLVAGPRDAVDLPEPASGPVVELLLTSKDEAWGDEDLGATSPSAAWRLAEARLLAQRVRAMRDAGRPAGEIVLLLRATTDMRVFERALEDQGVATYLIGGRGYWSGRQVRDLVAYLALLANPRDDLRLYEALSSPLAGVSSDTLVLLAEAAGPNGRICEVLERLTAPPDPDADSDSALAAITAEDIERAVVFWHRFVAHRAEAPRLGLDALIERIVRDADFDLAVLRMPGGERRMANVRKLMRLAREYESAEGRDLRGLVDHVDTLAGDVDGRDREGDAPVEGENLDAVRIMTVHRAKGLEFPVVCVADLGREPFTGGREYLRIGRDGTVGLKIPGLGDKDTPGAFDWEAIGTAEAKADADEERRLFYVAMTRAQEHLILSGATDLGKFAAGRSRETMGWLGTAVGGAGAVALTVEAPVVTAEPTRDAWSARVACALNAPATFGVVLAHEAKAPVLGPGDEAGDGREARAPGDDAQDGRAAPGCGEIDDASAPPALQRLPIGHLSYSSLGDHARCGYRFYLERILGLPREPEPRAAAGDGLPAAVRGTLVHALLERLDFTRPTRPDDAAIAELAAAHDAKPTPEEIDEIAELVASFLGTEICGRLAAAPRVRREEAFGFLLPATGAEPILLNGFIDALAWDGDRALVVDYKTDPVGESDLGVRVARDYRTQQVVYALAALHAGATEVDVAHVFLRRPDEPVVTRFVAGERAELEAELAERAAGILAGEFPVAPEPHRWLCQTCPGRASLCSWGPEMTGREPPWLAG